MRPRMTQKESYNHLLKNESFLAKIHSPIPQWIETQLDADFKDVAPITAEALKNAYDVIMSRIQNPIFLYHYRVLDNQLYKYIHPGDFLPSRDTHYERALKTLLSQVSIPDLDFIICPMDGIPEEIMPPNFYLLDDPEQQVPILGQAKLKEPLTHLIILIPDQMSVGDDWHNNATETLALKGQIPWSRKIGKAFWRGRISDNPLHLLKITPRFSVCRIAKQYPEFVDAASDYWPSLMGIVEKEGLHKMATFVLKQDHLRFKYQLALNGNVCTYPGYQWRLLSDSLTLKQESDQIQWFYGALEPYKHYLPIANDMSDLVEKVQWAEAHEPEVLKMIENAQQFASNNLMCEDCYRYLYLVLQRYEKYQQIDFKSLKRETKNDPRWVNIQYRKRLALLKMLQRCAQKMGKKISSPLLPPP